MTSKSIPITHETMKALERKWYSTYATLKYTRPFMYWCEECLGCRLNRRGTTTHPWILEFKTQALADKFKKDHVQTK